MWSFSVMRMWSQIHAELLSTVMLIINWQEPWTNQHITQFVICLFNLFPGHTEFSFFLFFFGPLTTSWLTLGGTKKSDKWEINKQ